MDSVDKGKGREKKIVAVHLLTSETIYLPVEVRCRVNELVGQICRYLGFVENMELFGLCVPHNRCFNAISDDGAHSVTDYVFLEPCRKLHKYAPKQWKTSKQGVDITKKPFFSCYLRVQFYVDCYLFLNDKIARHHYYLQMKSNVVNYGLSSLSEERAFLLASYAFQADIGNYDESKHARNYFNPHNYFPLWIIQKMGEDYLIRHSPSMHKEQRGLSRSEAEGMYIKEASDSGGSPHNIHLYRLFKCTSSSKKNAPKDPKIWLGICPHGVEIYEEEKQQSHGSYSISKSKTLLSDFLWPDIGKLCFDKKRFEIWSEGYPTRKFVYFTDSETLAKHLLWLCRITHTFQLFVEPRMREMRKREKQLQLSKTKYRESYIYSEEDGYDLHFLTNGKSKSENTLHLRHVDDVPSLGRFVAEVDRNQFRENSKSSNWHSDEQRISVISNSSSNTTSGIVSDKVHSINGDSEGDCVVDGVDASRSSRSPTLHSPLFDKPQHSLSSGALNEVSKRTAQLSARCVAAKPICTEMKSSILLNYSNTAYNGCSDGPQSACCSQKEKSILSTSSANSARSTSSDQSIATVKSVITLRTTKTEGTIMTPSAKITKNCSTDLRRQCDAATATSLPPDLSPVNVELCPIKPTKRNHPKLPVRSESLNHTYENIPFHIPLQGPSSSCPSPFSSRNATKIGISSLARNPNRTYQMRYAHGCVFNQHTAGSEPNLCNSKLWSPSLLPCDSDYQSLPKINDVPCDVVHRSESSSKASRANSDPTVLTLPYPQRKHVKKGVEAQQQPSFHHSLNNIAAGADQYPLRLVESDIGFNLGAVPPPPDYANVNHFIKGMTSRRNGFLYSQMPDGRPKATSEQQLNCPVLDLQQLKQKSQDMDLPLITALFNDRSLALPKTIASCTRKRHVENVRMDTRKTSDVYAVKLSGDLRTVTGCNGRPISEYGLRYRDKNQLLTSSCDEFNNNADFVEKLWAKYQLNVD